MTYNCNQEAIGCTNELFYRHGPKPENIQTGDAKYVLETIKRYLHEAFEAGQRDSTHTIPPHT